MNDREAIDKLLEEGIITHDEYRIIGKRIDRSIVYITDMLDNFGMWCYTKDYSKTTTTGYKVEVTAMFKFLNNVDKFSDLNFIEFKPISVDDFNSFIFHTIKTQTTDSSFRRTKYALRSFLRFLNETLGYNLDINGLVELDRYISKPSNFNRIVLREDEIYKVSNCSDLKSKVCILLCYEGILKRNELLSIRKDDFDFEKGLLTVYDNSINISDRKINRVVKLSKGLIDLTISYIRELYIQIDEWNNNRISIGKTPRSDYGFIFQSIKTSIPSYGVINNVFKNNAYKYYSSLDLSNEVIEQKVSNFTIETVRNSRRVYLFKEGYTTNKIMVMSGDSNYHSCNKFKKYVSIIYPESL